MTHPVGAALDHPLPLRERGWENYRYRVYYYLSAVVAGALKLDPSSMIDLSHGTCITLRKHTIKKAGKGLTENRVRIWPGALKVFSALILVAFDSFSMTGLGG